MVNRGVTPPDFESPVGLFRASYPDLTYVALDPPEAGYGDYVELSDLEIEGFLALGGGSINRGIGHYYIQLSGQAALRSKSLKDYDLAVDLTKRAADLRATAQFYFGLADDEDALAGDGDWLEIVPTGQSNGGVIPEATIPQYGRFYTWGRIN